MCPKRFSFEEELNEIRSGMYISLYRKCPLFLADLIRLEVYCILAPSVLFSDTSSIPDREPINFVQLNVSKISHPTDTEYLRILRLLKVDTLGQNF
jgi:hypothetical protein